MLENDKLKKLAAERIAEVYEKIKEANNLKEGAGKLADKVVASGLLTQGQAIKGVDEMGYMSQKLFTLRENEISQPLEFPEGIAVVRLTKIVRPEIEKFEIAREKVKSEAADREKTAAANDPGPKRGRRAEQACRRQKNRGILEKGRT